ncbi:LacI family DNA-binding transcriptional regulator [Methylovirgula sp. 4M-Z18]|uniref:LacI family DNA-binding transcriptional regulator n=1 Tax=Methylovirgula sp. 4M-Z18 TaxID=2293567 RepID=UPI000E2F4343|nr:LacI family DNA-binding transcriptional regulator [Methylovirgula sp. 4M-Z18]RFB79044.1 LacI family transcriptional regulator [Methylovirgula sp. 4M-Z18]
MSEKIISIMDVAKLARVSPATVSNTLTGRKPVSEKLAKRVREAARTLDYRVDPLASQLRTGEARIIAVVVPDLDNPFFTSVVSSIEQCLVAENYEVIVASAQGRVETETSRLKAILAWRPAGVIVLPCTDEFPGRELLENAGTPYVVADRGGDSLPADTVSIDNIAAGAAAVRHLVELGHTNILIAATLLELANIRQRCAGARDAMRQYGLPDPAVVELGLTSDEACKRLTAWFRDSATPTAVVALTNFTTLGVLTTIAEQGWRVAEQISLIGFDDYAWMSARTTPITAIRQPVREMGRAIWDLLSARIRGDLAPPKHVELPCELIIRASTRDVRHPAAPMNGP